MSGIAIITEACIDVKDRACVDVCPVQCIYEFDPQKNVLFSEEEAGSGVTENTHAGYFSEDNAAAAAGPHPEQRDTETAHGPQRVVRYYLHRWPSERSMKRARARISAGQAGRWTPGWFHDQGLHQLMGTIPISEGCVTRSRRPSVSQQRWEVPCWETGFPGHCPVSRWALEGRAQRGMRPATASRPPAASAPPGDHSAEAVGVFGG